MKWRALQESARATALADTNDVAARQAHEDAIEACKEAARTVEASLKGQLNVRAAPLRA